MMRLILSKVVEKVIVYKSALELSLAIEQKHLKTILPRRKHEAAGSNDPGN